MFQATNYNEAGNWRKLTAGELVRVHSEVVSYLSKHRTIEYVALINLTRVTGDQGRFYFREMLKRGVLRKIGRTSGTRYALKGPDGRPGILRVVVERPAVQHAASRPSPSGNGL